jgi:RNA recognition motif-containing protein
MNIYLGNLPYNINEDELMELFEEYGTVSSVKVITDKFSGKSKGFGFVEMADDAEAKKAIEELNGTEVKGRNISVNQAREKTEDRGGSRGGDRGGDRGRNFRR